MSSTLRIRSRKAIPTDCGQRSERGIYQLWVGLQLQVILLKFKVKNRCVSVNLDDGDVLFRTQLGDVILELDNNFDQTHDGVIHLVVRAVQLSCGCRLRKRE